MPKIRKKVKDLPIKDRIINAIRAAGGSIGYYDLARRVFPEDRYPRAFERPTRGGPPGCYMALSRALDRHGFSIRYSDMKGAGVVHSTIMMGSALRGGDSHA